VVTFDPLTEINLGGIGQTTPVKVYADVTSKYQSDSSGIDNPQPPLQVATITHCAPVATNMILYTDYNEELTFTLQPIPGDCTDTTEVYTTRLTKLPDTGTIYELHWNYRQHGITPRLGTAVTAVPYDLQSDHRLIWVAPARYETDTMRYLSIRASDNTSRTGFVQLMANTNSALRTYQHEFNTDSMSWSAGTDAYHRTTDVTWTATSVGTGINHYIYSDGGEPDVGMETGLPWYFQSPISMAGNYIMNYNGYLQFYIKPLAGDFSGALRSNPHTFLTLECASCDDGKGVRFAQRHFEATGGTQLVRYHLNEGEDHGWLKDPKDARDPTWNNPTQCEFLLMLAHLSSIRIYADLTTGYESVAIDGVEWILGDAVHPHPTGCYWTDE